MKELKTQPTIANTRNESYTNSVRINIIERCIQNPAKHLTERFVKIAYYCQNASSQMFYRVLNKPLLSFEFQNQPSRGFLRKCVLKKCSKFTGEHSCRSAISTKLQSNFIEITMALVLSCKFATYFQNTFSEEHLWATASGV